MFGKNPEMLHPPVLSVEKLCVPLPPKCIYPRQRNIAIREMVRQSHTITTVSRSLTSTKMARLSIVVSFALENFPALTRMNVTDWQPCICSTLTPNRSGKENPCYTQIRLQKNRILEIRELHNGWLQYGLNTLVNKFLPSVFANPFH